MTKRQLIDEIVTVNQSAQPAFLARFDDTDLNEYLLHLQLLKTPRFSGDARRFEKYFRNVPVIPTVPVSRPVKLAGPLPEPVVDDVPATVEKAHFEPVAEDVPLPASQGQIAQAEPEVTAGEEVCDDYGQVIFTQTVTTDHYAPASPVADMDTFTQGVCEPSPEVEMELEQAVMVGSPVANGETQDGNSTQENSDTWLF